MLPRKALGKGLASLIPQTPIAAQMATAAGVLESPPATLGVQKVSIDAIVPNRLQPRKTFDEAALEDLASSIRIHGIIQPIVACPLPNGRYEIIAGERRWRAARRAGLSEVPVVTQVVDDETMLELAIIENIQREDLGPLEEAAAYRELIQQFGYSQEEVADKVGKSRPAVANSLRLLNLPKVVQEDIAAGRMTAGHARALLSLENLQDQLTIREQVLRSQLTVRDVERLVQFRMNRGLKTDSDGKTASDRRLLSPQWKQVQEDLTMAFGTKVILHPNADMKGGKIVVEFYSTQDLSRIHDLVVERT